MRYLGFLLILFLLPVSFVTAQDPPAGSSNLDRNACYEGGFLNPCATPYDWQAGWYLQNWIDSGYNPTALNDLFAWATNQYVAANPDIFTTESNPFITDAFGVCYNVTGLTQGGVPVLSVRLNNTFPNWGMSIYTQPNCPTGGAPEAVNAFLVQGGTLSVAEANAVCNSLRAGYTFQEIISPNVIAGGAYYGCQP